MQKDDTYQAKNETTQETQKMFDTIQTVFDSIQIISESLMNRFRQIWDDSYMDRFKVDVNRFTWSQRLHWIDSNQNESIQID